MECMAACGSQNYSRSWFDTVISKLSRGGETSKKWCYIWGFIFLQV